MSNRCYRRGVAEKRRPWSVFLPFVEMIILSFLTVTVRAADMNAPLLTSDVETYSMASGATGEPASSNISQSYSKTKRIGLGDWLSFSANLDLSHRTTQFYQAGHNTTLFQWDTRMDVWLPPGRDDFSWGPYLRYAGVESTRPYEWENNWGARPAYGFQAYLFSSKDARNSQDPLMQWLWPIHAFIEHGNVYYKGEENSWRPDYQTRVGVDYWKEVYVHDLTKPLWAEIWNGLIWLQTNGFDKNYRTLVFANSLRLGLRKPDAELLSTISPYAVLESSLSENGEYFWENRLIGGGGIRFSLPHDRLPENLQWLDRLVIYTEYLVPLAYYRSSPPSSSPDHDFRFGVNLVVGEWWYK